MNFEVLTIPRFEKAVKGLAKKYRSLKADLEKLILLLENNPCQGDELTPGVRKIRMAITSKGRGKSGGARVITYNIFVDDDSGRVYLIDIYDKSDFSTVEVDKIRKIISDLGL